MFETEYLPLQNINKTTSSPLGGFCRWWFIPVEDILLFPTIDPATQQYLSEPSLKPGKNWYGPVKVPDSQLGWQQKSQKSKPGKYYIQKVEGFLPGNDTNSYINLGNLSHHQFCIKGKLRTNGMYVLIGTLDSALDMDEDYDTGAGAKDTPGTRITFTGETIHKSTVMAL